MSVTRPEVIPVTVRLARANVMTMLRNQLPRLTTSVLAILCVGLALTGLPFVTLIENAWFDVSGQSNAPPPWPDDLVLVVIDGQSISRLAADGQFPVQRKKLLHVWNRLAEAGARTIVYDAPVLSRTDPETDAKVVRALGRVHLPVVFQARPMPEASALLPGYALPAPPESCDDEKNLVLALENLVPSLEEFSAAAAGIGHVVFTYDDRHSIRTHRPMICIRGQGRIVPSLPLVALAAQRDFDLQDVVWTPDSLSLPGIGVLPMTKGRILLRLSSPQKLPRPLTAIEVLDLEEEDLRAEVAGKLVLIYVDTVGDQHRTGVGSMPGGLILAQMIRTLAASQAPRYLSLPYVLVPLFLGMFLSAPRLARLAPRSVGLLSASCLLLYFACQILIFRSFDVFLPLTLPLLLLFACGVALTMHATLGLRRRLEEAEGRADAERAPRGEIALVFTDVQGSTRLWERAHDAMRRALELHDRLLRELIEETCGYEVKTEGDAFMVAFPDAPTAARWCVAVQRRLLDLPWPESLLAEPDAREERDEKGKVLFRGLRVRMGIHLGTPEPKIDPRTGRMDYFGPHVNRAARIASSAYGGQVLAGEDAWNRIGEVLDALPILSREVGAHRLKGLSGEERLVELLPVSLGGRTFAPTSERATSS